MIPITKKLSPFLTLKAVTTDKFKTERFSLTVKTVPDKRLTPVTKFVFSVLKRGCEEYPTKKALNQKFDDLYSSAVYPIATKCGGCYRFGFSAEMLGNEYVLEDINIFEETLDLLFKIFFKPLIDENGQFLRKYVESERENICDAIKSIINVPRTYAINRFLETMYEGDLYSIASSGTVELINSITVEELMSAYYNLVQNSSYEVFYVGSKSPDEVEKAVIKQFNKYPYGKENYVDNRVEFKLDTKSVKRVNENIQISQGILIMGFKTGVNITCGKDYYSTLVLNEIFGGSPVSKLFMNVRERLSLCYYCTSRFNAQKGYIMAASEIEKSEKKRVEKEILRQFEKIQKGKITEAELSAAKKALINMYSETTDSASGIERFYEIRSDFGVLDSIEDAKRKVSEITLEDVVGVAQNIKLDTVYFLSGKEENDDLQ